MQPQGRLGDKALSVDAHGCPACPHVVIGPAVQGSPDVFVNSLPGLRVGDPGIHTACCSSNKWNAKKGSKTVFINGKPAYRMLDQDKHCGGDGVLLQGSVNVLVGDSQCQAMKDAAESGAPCVERCGSDLTNFQKLLERMRAAGEIANEIVGPVLRGYVFEALLGGKVSQEGEPSVTLYGEVREETKKWEPKEKLEECRQDINILITPTEKTIVIGSKVEFQVTTNPPNEYSKVKVEVEGGVLVSSQAFFPFRGKFTAEFNENSELDNYNKRVHKVTVTFGEKTATADITVVAIRSVSYKQKITTKNNQEIFKVPVNADINFDVETEPPGHYGLVEVGAGHSWSDTGISVDYNKSNGKITGNFLRPSETENDYKELKVRVGSSSLVAKVFVEEISEEICIKITGMSLPNEKVSFTTQEGENAIQLIANIQPNSLAEANNPNIEWEIKDDPNEGGISPAPNVSALRGNQVTIKINIKKIKTGRNYNRLNYIVRAKVKINTGGKEKYYFSDWEAFKQDEKDMLRQQYYDMGKNRVPDRNEFINSGKSIYFDLIREGACKCGRHTYHLWSIMENLDNVREIMKEPLTVNSGYRCPLHNKSISGGKNSEHIYGKAADIHVGNWKTTPVYKSPCPVKNTKSWSRWVKLRNAARAEGAVNIEAFEKTGSWVHMDWGIKRKTDWYDLNTSQIK